MWSIQGNIVLSSCRYCGIILHATFVEEDSKGQICTNGASSDRISKNTLKNKGIIMKMRIGRHDIQGTKQILAKPFVVLTDLEHSKQFKAIGLVREKFVFHERPQIT